MTEEDYSKDMGVYGRNPTRTGNTLTGMKSGALCGGKKTLQLTGLALGGSAFVVHRGGLISR